MKLLSDPDFCASFVKAQYSAARMDIRPFFTHVRLQHGMLLRLGGNTRYRFDDRVIATKPGDLLYIGKGVKYTIDRREGGECLLLNFGTTAEYEPEVRMIHTKSMGQYEGLFRRALRYEAEGCQTGKKAMLYEIITQFTREMEAEYCPDSKAKLLLPAMEAFSCAAPPSMAELAEACGISETYFRQLFFAVYGRNPAEYFLNLRMEEAKKQLGTGCSIKTAALAAGFADTSYFTKVFRRVTGMLPGEFVRELDG